MGNEAVREERRLRIAQLREELGMLIREDREDVDESKGDLLARCHELMADNLKLAAIRLYRDETGSTLMEAAHALGIIVPAFHAVTLKQGLS